MDIEYYNITDKKYFDKLADANKFILKIIIKNKIKFFIFIVTLFKYLNCFIILTFFFIIVTTK